MPLSNYLAPSAIARLCPDCQTEQPLTNYTIRKDGKVAAYCKPCNAKRTAAYRANNRERYLQNRREQRAKRNAKFSARAIKARWDSMTGDEQNAIECGIYCITIGDKFYIGSTTNLKDRIEGHTKRIGLGDHVNKRMMEAFSTYGTFDAELIERCAPDELSDLEMAYIGQWFGHPDCLNANRQTDNGPRFTAEEADAIRSRIAVGESQAEVARSLGCSQPTIHEVVYFKGPYRRVV